MYIAMCGIERDEEYEKIYLPVVLLFSYNNMFWKEF